MPASLLRADTIVAVATGQGRGAISVIRVSGGNAEEVCRRVVLPARGWPVNPRESTRCRIHEPDDSSRMIDDGLVTLFPAPRSFTGETVLELATHGGEYVPHAVCAAIVLAGARPASPGEFSARAVLNGKMDLLGAEATAELIEARSRASHRAALQQVSGLLSSRVMRLREATVELEAMLAFDIDFPEEDDGTMPRDRIEEACAAVCRQLEALLATAPAAALGRQGATIVLAGPPNAGKSALLNALVGEARVIVSDVPGTTRDAVEVLLEHDPWPLRLVDTAGLRESPDPVEQMGIDISRRFLADAHAVVVCAGSVPDLLSAAHGIRQRTMAPLVGALTKADLRPTDPDLADAPFPVISVSSVDGTGLRALLSQVTASVTAVVGSISADTPIVTRARHRSALSQAHAELSAFQEAWRAELLPPTVAATHVRAACTALDELIGSVDVNDVFARVFATFCVGK